MYNKNNGLKNKPKPTGRRKIPKEWNYLVERSKSEWALPEDIHPRKLLDQVKAARKSYGFSPGALELLGYLFDFTQARDWQSDSRPLVWPSNEKLMFELNLETVEGVKKRIRELVKAGLVVMKDNPTGKRYGCRDKDGKIIVARSWGFDLSPLWFRLEEFANAAEKQKATHRQKLILRGLCYGAKTGLLQIFDSVEVQGLYTSYWEALDGHMQPLFDKIAQTHDIESLDTLKCELEALEADARQVLMTAMENDGDEAVHNTVLESLQSEEITPLGVQMDTLKNTTKICSNLNLVEAWQRSRSREAVLSKSRSEGEARSFVGENYSFTVQDIGELIPDIGDLLPDHATFNSLTQIMDSMRKDWEISDRLWIDAINELGLARAILAFTIVIYWGRDHYRSSPGGYFHTMIKRGGSGDLNLQKSLFRMRDQGPKDRFSLDLESPVFPDLSIVAKKPLASPELLRSLENKDF